jgi:hypothetical protein
MERGRSRVSFPGAVVQNLRKSENVCSSVVPGRKINSLTAKGAKDRRARRKSIEYLQEVGCNSPVLRGTKYVKGTEMKGLSPGTRHF